ncbi:MAG TPA: hypothetical protein VII75_00060 [Thermoanaerobaculia bacterium]|nr:hypothetical protein [Thermoanaerobaculia bacterium]
MLAAIVIVLAAHRDLFRFVEPPPRPAVVKKKDPVPVVVRVIQEEQKHEVKQVLQAPTFPYRCIGRFGPDANPFAVFDAGGAIINVRVGEVIDGKFIVRAIGFETITIGVDGFSTEQRIAIGTPR